MSARRSVVTLGARGVIGGPPRALRWLRVCVAAAGLVAVVAGAVAASPVAAQDNGGSSDVEVRIVARKLESGRVEFGLQQRQTDNSWGDRRLPRVRFFPTSAGVGRWLASSPLTLPAGEVRIVARRLESGRVEFGLQQRQTDNSWGDRRLPRVRFFPTSAGVGRWLASSPLTLGTSPPADRATTPTDGGRTDSPPADRATTPTGGDPSALSGRHTVEVANAHHWWARPRGDLVVHIHLCVEQGNEHLAKREIIDAYVSALNEIHAPFYTWQSSGLLNVSFTAGQIAIANDVAPHWYLGYLPRSCREELGLGHVEGGVGHTVLMAGNPQRVSWGGGGWGNLAGPLSAVDIGPADKREVAHLIPTPSPDSTRDVRPPFLSTFRHELDHNIGNPHLNNAGYIGYTRFRFVSLEERQWWEPERGDHGVARMGGRRGQIVGTLAGFPAALRQNVVPQQDVFTLLSCYFLEAQGWPVGPNAPACVRPGPLEVRDLGIDWSADGRPRLTWRPGPSGYENQPVTGYRIIHWSSRVTFDLPADARSFVLPPNPSGEYQVGEQLEISIIPRSPIGFGEMRGVRAGVGFPQTAISIEEVGDRCIESNCGPRVFKLSWPSNDLVERWLVLGPEGTYWNRPTTHSSRGPGPSSVVHETSNNVYYIVEGAESEDVGMIRGKTYEFTVFGCLKDPQPIDDFTISPGCFPYATATFMPEPPVVTSGAVTWTYTGVETRQCPDCPVQDRRYKAEWTHIPGTTLYHVWARECTDALRPSCHFDVALVDTVVPDSSGTVTTHFFLLSDTRYEVDIHACGPEDDASQMPSPCPVLIRTEVTIPPSGI